MKAAKLQLVAMHRIGSPGKHERHTFDFVVNGVSLAGRLGVSRLDLVGRLDVSDKKCNVDAVGKLLLDEPADIGTGRVMLFVCPECGHLGCGAFTVAVARASDSYVWSEFRYENDYDPMMTDPVKNLGPFEFAADEYRALLIGTATPN